MLTALCFAVCVRVCDDARFQYALLLVKSHEKLDVSNAAFHLLELLAANPLNRVYLFHLALAQFKLGEFSKAKVTLDNLDKVPLDAEEKGGAGATATVAAGVGGGAAPSAVPTVLQRKAKALRAECERAQAKERLLGVAFAGVALTSGIGALLVAGLVVSKALKR
jgi:hypothetical protein